MVQFLLQQVYVNYADLSERLLSTYSVFDYLAYAVRRLVLICSLTVEFTITSSYRNVVNNAFKL